MRFISCCYSYRCSPAHFWAWPLFRKADKLAQRDSWRKVPSLTGTRIASTGYHLKVSANLSSSDGGCVMDRLRWRYSVNKRAEWLQKACRGTDKRMKPFSSRCCLSLVLSFLNTSAMSLCQAEDEVFCEPHEQTAFTQTKQPELWHQTVYLSMNCTKWYYVNKKIIGVYFTKNIQYFHLKTNQCVLHAVCL